MPTLWATNSWYTNKLYKSKSYGLASDRKLRVLQKCPHKRIPVPCSILAQYRHIRGEIDAKAAHTGKRGAGLQPSPATDTGQTVATGQGVHSGQWVHIGMVVHIGKVVHLHWRVSWHGVIILLITRGILMFCCDVAVQVCGGMVIVCGWAAVGVRCCAGRSMSIVKVVVVVENHRKHDIHVQHRHVQPSRVVKQTVLSTKCQLGQEKPDLGASTWADVVHSGQWQQGNEICHGVLRQLCWFLLVHGQADCFKRRPVAQLMQHGVGRGVVGAVDMVVAT